MDCLIGKIGVLGYSNTSYYQTYGVYPELFINSLPGISLKGIESLTEAEQRDYLGVWNDIQLRAAKRYKNDIISKLSKRYKLNQIQKSIDLGYEYGTAESKTSNRFKGIVIDLDSGLGINREYKTSALQGVYVHEVNLFIDNITAGNNITLKINDFYNYTAEGSNWTSPTFTSLTIASIGNAPYKIPVRRFFPFRKVAIQLDSTYTALNGLTIPQSTSDYTSHTIQGFYSTGQLNSSNTTAVYSNDAHGVSVVYSVRCQYDTFVCNNMDVFLPAWWYLLGSELTVERIYSNKINRWTIKNEEGEKLKAYFDTEYEKMLDTVCDSIDLDNNDICLECNDQYTTKESNFF